LHPKTNANKTVVAKEPPTIHHEDIPSLTNQQKIIAEKFTDVLYGLPITDLVRILHKQHKLDVYALHSAIEKEDKKKFYDLSQAPKHIFGVVVDKFESSLSQENAAIKLAKTQMDWKESLEVRHKIKEWSTHNTKADNTIRRVINRADLLIAILIKRFKDIEHVKEGHSKKDLSDFRTVLRTEPYAAQSTCIHLMVSTSTCIKNV
jgi:hypothetical protein